MDAVIDYIRGHLEEFFYITLGMTVILYSCFAKRMSFEGDVAGRKGKRSKQRQRCANMGFVLAWLRYFMAFICCFIR